MKKNNLLIGAIALAITGNAAAQFNYAPPTEKFTLPPELYDKPLNEITLPGTHNSFNERGSYEGCVDRNSAGDINVWKRIGIFAGNTLTFNQLANNNRNVNFGIPRQIVDFGLRFLEIDTYNINGNWCVFHSGPGNPQLDGTNYKLENIIYQIATSAKKIGKDPIIIKWDGDRVPRQVLLREFAKYGYGEDAFYEHPEEGDLELPSINELAAQGKKFIMNNGDLSAHLDTLSTSPKREKPDKVFNHIWNNEDREHHLTRFNAFALKDTLKYGSTDDAKYIVKRIFTYSLLKWVQAGQRINQIVVDFPSIGEYNMTAMRAAMIMNQIPSIKGKFVDEDDNPIKGVKIRYRIDNINVSDQWEQALRPGSTVISGALPSEVDLPRPKGQTLRIEPYKRDYHFEPSVIYVEPDVAEDFEFKFRAIPGLTANDVARRHAIVYKKGDVTLDNGVGIDDENRTVVRDVTRNQWFAITNKGSGLCVTGGAYATYVTMQNCDGAQHQKWRFNPVNGQIRLKRDSSNIPLCLDHISGRSGEKTIINHCANSPTQKFTLIGQRIVPQQAQAVALDSGGLQAGSNLIVWNRKNDDDNNRYWIFERHYKTSATGRNYVSDDRVLGADQYFLINANNKPHCLRAVGGKNQADVDAAHCYTQGIFTGFSLWKNYGGKFENKLAKGFCLDDTGNKNADSKVWMWSCANTPNQNWNFVMPYNGGEPSGVSGAALYNGKI